MGGLCILAFWLLPLVIWHILQGLVKYLICMDFMKFSTVVAPDKTISISNPTLELWELSNSALEVSFTRKMMCWQQPTGPPELLNYWSRETKCSLHHSFYKYNHLCTYRWKLFFCWILYFILYCLLPTAYCIIYCAVYTVYGTEYYEHYDRHWTAQQIILERKLAIGFSSNVEGNASLTSEIRYIRRKYTDKHRRSQRSLSKRSWKRAR